MAQKTVQISARISSEDAAFLSKLVVNGARTPSDKLRAIISEARKRSLSRQDYSGCYKMIQDLAAPMNETIRKHELKNNIHSELVTRFIEWLPDLVAYAMSSVPKDETPDAATALVEYEQGLADRIFRFFESATQMGVTGKSPCYNHEIIRTKLGPILNLTTIINKLDQ